MNLTAAAVRRRVATSVIAVALVILGLLALWRLPVNFLPDMTYPLIKVHIWWRGATPGEMEKNLAEPIERQMATVDGLDYLESSSIEGMYTLQANFRYGVDVNVAYQDAMAAMARVARDLPKDIDPPIVVKADPSQLPVVQLTVQSDKWDLVKLRTWTDQWLQDQLLAVPGVAGTDIAGGLKREIRVYLDPSALEKVGLSLDTVLKRLREENIEQFGGRVTSGRQEIIARTMGEFRAVKDVQSVLLARQGAAKVLLGDVARVEDAHEEVRLITRLGGKPCVKVSVLKQADANTVEVAKALAQRIQELAPTLPGGVRIGMVENQADYVSAALNGVRNTAIEAAILVMLVIYLFLGSWRQVLVVLLALPTTLILNFGIMKLLGFSLNIFSLGGLVIAISVVLDNSIIVLENIVRLRRKLDESEVEEFAISGTTEVGPAIIAATVSFLALFVPFLLVPGLTSLLFRELILVISGIVLVSLLVALTLTPMLSALLLKAPAKETRFERFFDRLTQAYGQYLGSALQKPWRVVGGFFVVLAVAGLLAPGIGGEFLPPMDDGRVVIKVKLPTGAALNETNKILHRIEKLLEGDPLIKSSFTLVGGKVWGLYTYEIANEGEIDLQLVPRHSRKLSTKQYIARLRSKVAKVPIAGGQAMVSQMKIKGLRNLGEADIEMKVRGDDVNKLFGLAKQAAEKMNESAHFTNVYVSLDLSKPEYRIKLDRVRAAELGVSAADLANTLRSLLSGAVPTQFRDGDEYYNVRVMVPESGIRSRQDIENLPLKGSLGDYLRIRDVAEVERAVGPVEILRENQVKEVIVRGDASGVSVGQALSELKALMDQMERPAGYEIQYGGQAQMMGEMQRSALSILFFAVFFAFLVLAVQFNRLKLPALILACVPVSLAGMAYALFLTRLPLGATVLIGALVVTAATINDGVLLFTFADELVEGGRPSFPAVIEAAKIRLRPRLMTTLPIIFGLVPLALNLEEGGDMLQPMAAAAIGGLILVLPVALLLMPCIYLIFTRKGGHPDPKERLVKKIAAKENEL